MGQMENPVRYSVITEKNPREIVMLRGSGCRFLRCRFCDYHLDSSRDQAANDRINKEALSHVTGQYHSLEVINSGSFLELSEETMARIERVCLEKHITQLRFEIHWMYREHVKKWREHFAEKGITVKIKMGVETFDDAFRREVFDKGMEGVTPQDAAKVADEVCLLFGVTGQTAQSMRYDIETGLRYFERICINIMVENTSQIQPDPQVIKIFIDNFYEMYKDDPRVDILLENTDFGVGGKRDERDIISGKFICDLRMRAVGVPAVWQERAVLLYGHRDYHRQHRSADHGESLRHGADAGKYPVCIHLPGDGYHQ